MPGDADGLRAPARGETEVLRSPSREESGAPHDNVKTNNIWIQQPAASTKNAAGAPLVASILALVFASLNLLADALDILTDRRKARSSGGEK
jgi:hypothetical protein